jgi:hypothetical protein
VAVIVSMPKREWVVADEGLHEAVCIDCVDRGIEESPWGPAHRVELRWALDQQDEQGRAVIVSRRYKASLHPKSKLREHLELWRGKKFTDDELRGFDLEVVVGKGCQIQITHNITDDGSVFANVAAIIAANRKSTGVPLPREYVRMKDRPTDRQMTGTTNGHGNASKVDDDDDRVPF